MKIRTVDQEDYVRFFTKNPESSDAGSSEQIRLYRVEDSVNNIKTPTPLFRPTFNCIVFITKGKLKLHADTSTIILKQNTIFNSRSGHISATLGYSKDVKGYFLAYEDDMLTRLFSAHEIIKIHSLGSELKLPKQKMEWFLQLLVLLETELSGASGPGSAAASLFQASCRKLIELSGKQQHFSDKSTQIAYAFRELAHRFHKTEKSVGYYAQALSISENYLNRCVKDCTGKAPKNILIDLDMENAVFLLQQPYAEIADIALQLGYLDSSYFSRLFKKVTGYTPTTYRTKK